MIDRLVTASRKYSGMETKTNQVNDASAQQQQTQQTNNAPTGQPQQNVAEERMDDSLDPKLIEQIKNAKPETIAKALKLQEEQLSLLKKHIEQDKSRKIQNSKNNLNQFLDIIKKENGEEAAAKLQQFFDRLVEGKFDINNDIKNVDEFNQISTELCAFSERLLKKFNYRTDPEPKKLKRPLESTQIDVAASMNSGSFNKGGQEKTLNETTTSHQNDSSILELLRMDPQSFNALKGRYNFDDEPERILKLVRK